MQKLEAELKVKLLNRTTRRVVVTDDGAAYYERLVRLLDEFDDLHRAVVTAQTSPSGRLRVEMGGPTAQFIDGHEAAILGSFSHVVKSTSKPFRTPFAMHLRVNSERISRLHLYDDRLVVAQAFDVA